MNKKGQVGLALLAVVLFIILALGMSWLVTGNDFFLYKVFAPKRAQVGREVFEQSKSYRQGVIQEVRNHQLEYIREKDPDAKKAIANVILQQTADFPEADMPGDVASFIEELKSKQQ